MGERAPLEPSLALIRQGLGEIAPGRAAGAQPPSRTTLKVNFEKIRKVEKYRGVERKTGADSNGKSENSKQNERKKSGWIPKNESKKSEGAKCRISDARIHSEGRTRRIEFN